MQYDNLAVPQPPTPEQMEEFKTEVANCTPAKIIGRLFASLAHAGNNLCNYGSEQLALMLATIDDEAAAAALKKCPCKSCLLRIDYIRQIGPLLLDAMQKVAELHRLLEPRVVEIAKGAERKEAARETLSVEIRRLERAGKLALS